VLKPERDDIARLETKHKRIVSMQYRWYSLPMRFVTILTYGH
jgi:hypothetical protein